MQVRDNAEINAIIKIMGLKYGKKYSQEDDLKSLRYGKIMIMTDQVKISVLKSKHFSSILIKNLVFFYQLLFSAFTPYKKSLKKLQF